MTLRQTLIDIFERDRDLSRLHAELVRLRAEGIDRELLISELMAYRYSLKKDEADEDFLLEVLDCFYGWCASQLRID